MNTAYFATYQEKLLAERDWCEGVVDHLNDYAAMDSLSDYTVRMAERKLKGIRRELRKITDGSHGYCEKCGYAIEPERLEILLTSDDYLCAHCASALILKRSGPPARQTKITYRLAPSAGW